MSTESKDVQAAPVDLSTLPVNKMTKTQLVSEVTRLREEYEAMEDLRADVRRAGEMQAEMATQIEKATHEAECLAARVARSEQAASSYRVRLEVESECHKETMAMLVIERRNVQLLEGAVKTGADIRALLPDGGEIYCLDEEEEAPATSMPPPGPLDHATKRPRTSGKQLPAGMPTPVAHST